MLPPPKPPVVADRSFVLPAGCDEVLHLMGSTGLADFMAYARDCIELSANRVEAASAMSPMDLAEAWRDAAQVYQALAETDAYPVEVPGVFPLPDTMQEHCQAFLGKAHIQREFDRVPIALAMVPLEYLIAMQPRLNMGTANSADVGTGSISDASLVQICLPHEAPPHRLQVLQKSADGITFAADNHDVRLLQAHTVSGASINLSTRGHVEQVLALAVGFSSNVLNVIRYQNRLVLNNGYHRAFALLRRGVTHAPAVIQVCRHWEDVGLVGSTEVYENGSVYFERERPPLLKDFVDRRLCMAFAMPRSRKYVRIRYQVETGYLAE